MSLNLKSLNLVSPTLLLCLIPSLALTPILLNLNVSPGQAEPTLPPGEGTIQRDDDRSAQNRKSKADRLFQEAIQQYRQGKYQEALQKFQQVLAIRKEISDKAGEARTLHKIGSVYFRQGQYQQALNFYQQALPIRRTIGDKAGEAHTLNNIGEVYSRLGQNTQAQQFFKQANAIYKQIGVRQESGSPDADVAGVRNVLRDDDEVQTSATTPKPRTPRVGTSSGEGSVLPDEGESTR